MSDSVSKIYILVENPSKSNNLGPILRCGAAFAATFIFIGYEKCAVSTNTFPCSVQDEDGDEDQSGVVHAHIVDR